ncbi:MAG: glycosyltransferase family 4 protein, partial [Solirubrobacterales bacterium]|nr:glycosyltransferase family 4 protein [Solirubrobacterales bacterium]
DFERQVRAWARELERAGAPDADLLHLHHLTPLNEAAARVAPDVPVIGQLHGTELSMLEQIAAGPPPGWTHATRWVERMREWAHRCSRLIVAPGGEQRAVTALGVPRGRLVSLPNGVDIERFRRRPIDRGRFWRRVLSEAPRGWLPGRPPGSVRYDPADVAELARTVVLLYVGRFTAVKRLDRLIGAFATARPRMAAPAALVLLGGHPGEWEHEHPADLVVAGHVADVYLAGWYAHESLPEFFSASDAVLTASEREQFGLTLIEGMACGIPAVAARSLGPELIIDPGRTGWLADSEAQLAESLIEVVNDPAERTRRGAAAKEAVGERFSWPSVAGRLAAVMDDVLAGATAPPAGEA